VQLARLSEDETGELIEALGYERSASLTTRIYRQSGGTPFFATEIVRTLDSATEPHVPDSVRGAIGHRLRQLSEPCHRILRIAAVLGPEFQLASLEGVAVGQDAALPVLRALDEARDARIVVETHEGAAGYGFAHALFREVLYRGLPLGERLQLQWQVALALEALGGPSREHGAFALAHHFFEAIAGCADEPQRRVCIDKAVHYATRAAEEADQMAAYEEAVAQYQRAVSLLEPMVDADRSGTDRRADGASDGGRPDGRAARESRNAHVRAVYAPVRGARAGPARYAGA
jgi:predicted ATPase